MSRHAFRYLTACACLALLGVGASFFARGQGAHAATPPDWDRTLPLSIGPWSGQALPTDEGLVRYLSADAMANRLYRRGGAALGFCAIFGTQWRTLHSPAGCYPSQGWQTIERKAIEVEPHGPLPHAGPLQAEQLFVKKGKEYRLVVYLYAFHGGTTASWVEECLKVATCGLKAGGITIMVDALTSEQAKDAAHAAAADLVARLYPYVVRGWYRG